MEICKKCGRIASFNTYFKGLYCGNCGSLSHDDTYTEGTYGELYEYKKLGYSPQELNKRLELADKYENLDKQNRLIELPCAVGTPVYITDENCDLCEGECEWDENDNAVCCSKSYVRQVEFCIGFRNYIGKHMFLTIEEAEDYLKVNKKVN